MLSVGISRPGVTIVYIGLTRRTAKSLAWSELVRLNHRFRLGITFNQSELTATLANGSRIVCTGAHDSAAIEVLRGGKYALVYVDECASYGKHFETLIGDIIQPALTDLRGTLALIGTPGAACTGYFYERTQKAESFGFSTHHWTIIDNPHIPHAADELAKERSDNAWTDQNPTMRREWYGEWVRSLDSLVYRFDGERNTFTDLPVAGEWANVMGVDLGYNDAFVISVLRYSFDEPKALVVDTFSRTGSTPSMWAEWVDAYATTYQPTAIVADAGGLGKAIVEEMRDKWALPIKAAEKAKKPAYIELMNGDLESGRLKVHSSLTGLRDQMLTLQWDAKRPGIKENEDYPNDLCDATLYAWRECRHHRSATPPPRPAEGTDAWRKELEVKMRELAMKRARQQGLGAAETYLNGTITDFR